jgi:hypothetical protein
LLPLSLRIPSLVYPYNMTQPSRCQEQSVLARARRVAWQISRRRQRATRLGLRAVRPSAGPRTKRSGSPVNRLLAGGPPGCSVSKEKVPVTGTRPRRRARNRRTRDIASPSGVSQAPSREPAFSESIDSEIAEHHDGSRLGADTEFIKASAYRDRHCCVTRT